MRVYFHYEWFIFPSFLLESLYIHFFSLARFFCRTTVLLSSTHTHTHPPSLPPRDTVVVFDCPDKHTLCLDCFMEYCEVQLQDRQFEEHRSAGYTLRCPAKCEGSEIKESHHFRIMGPEKVCSIYMHKRRYIAWAMPCGDESYMYFCNKFQRFWSRQASSNGNSEWRTNRKKL